MSASATRRGMLGAMVVTPMVIAAPSMAAAPSSDWRAALAAYTRAKAAEDRYGQIQFGHIHRLPFGAERSDLCRKITKAQSDTMQQFNEALADAEDQLMKTPAPHLAAVIFKIELARKSSADFEDWPDSWWDAVMTDLRRLSAGGHN